MSSFLFIFTVFQGKFDIYPKVRNIFSPVKNRENCVYPYPLYQFTFVLHYCPSLCMNEAKKGASWAFLRKIEVYVMCDILNLAEGYMRCFFSVLLKCCVSVQAWMKLFAYSVILLCLIE